MADKKGDIPQVKSERISTANEGDLLEEDEELQGAEGGQEENDQPNPQTSESEEEYDDDMNDQQMRTALLAAMGGGANDQLKFGRELEDQLKDIKVAPNLTIRLIRHEAQDQAGRGNGNRREISTKLITSLKKFRGDDPNYSGPNFC